MKNHSHFFTNTSIFGALCGMFLAFGSFSQIRADDSLFSLYSPTYHVEVRVESTHVSANTTSYSWRSVFSSESQKEAEMFHAALQAAFQLGEIDSLVLDFTPSYDQTVVNLRLRTEYPTIEAILPDEKKIRKLRR